MKAPLIEDESEYKSPYRTRMKKIGIAVAVVFTVVVVSGVVGWFVVLPKVVRGVLENSEISFTSIKIADWGNNTFNLKTNAQLKYHSPMESALRESVVNIFWENQELGNLLFPEMKLPAGDSHNFTMDGPFTITDLEVWKKFSRNLMSEKTLTWHMKSSMTVTLLGKDFTDIPMEKDLPIGGLGGFKDPAISLAQPVVKSGTSSELIIELGLVVPNPTINTLDLGMVTQEVHYLGKKIGETTLEMVLVPGDNKFISNARLFRLPDRSNEEALTAFFTEHMSGRDTTLSIKATEEGTPITLLKASIASMNANAILPGMQPQMMMKAELTFHFVSLLKKSLSCKITMSNNFPAPVKLVKGSFLVHTSEGRKEMGKLQEDMNFVVPGNTTVVTPYYDFRVTGITLEAAKAITSQLYVDIKGTLDANVGDFPLVNVGYEQKRVPSTFSLFRKRRL